MKLQYTIPEGFIEIYAEFAEEGDFVMDVNSKSWKYVHTKMRTSSVIIRSTFKTDPEGIERALAGADKGMFSLHNFRVLAHAYRNAREKLIKINLDEVLSRCQTNLNKHR